MALELRPVVYVMQPDYWLMALVGCVPKGTVKPAAPAEFAAELDMHVALGRKGVDLSGDANGNSLRLELPD